MRTPILKTKGLRQRAIGTTLVEVLVVMVIFLLGILAVLQIFPGGIKVLSQSRDRAIGAALTQGETERIKGRTDQLPELILPVIATWTALGVRLEADSNRVPNELGPVASAMDASGNLLDDDGNILGPWELLSGANMTRRVVGEGGVIPAPRAVGSLYGGLLVLQFAPIVFDPQYVEYFEVYGNDMVQLYGDPSGWRTRDYQFYANDLDTAGAVIYLPRSQTKTRHFRLSLSATVKVGSSLQQKDIVSSTPIEVPADSNGGYLKVDLDDYILASGETLVYVDGDSLKVARLFDRVSSFTADPYEYQLVDQKLGLVLFNPAGYNYKERRQGGRLVPLVGRVNYDVYDWRILREDIRIPGTERPFYQLPLGNLVINGKPGPDNQTVLPMPIGAGAVINKPAVALLDLDSGSIYSANSISVDGSRGVISFIDGDNDAMNGIQMEMLPPDGSAPITVNASGRSVRVLYMANNQWSVQVTKAANRYTRSWNRPGVAQYYVGNLVTGVGNPTRIYFPRNDVGKKVTIDTIYYRRSGDDLTLAPRELSGQDYLITASTDPMGPYVDITSIDPDAIRIDTPVYQSDGTLVSGSYYMYGVRNVKGASIGVRTLWNPNFFTLGSDSASNMKEFNKWMAGWRKSQTETYLQRSEN